jgi:hypothetical protein
MIESYDDEEQQKGSETSSNVDSQSNSGRDQHSQASSEPSLAGTETKHVNRSKWVVVLVLFASAAAAGAATFCLTKNEEQDSFESEVTNIINAAVKRTRPHSKFVAHTLGSSRYPNSSMTLQQKSLILCITKPPMCSVLLKV